MNTLKGPGYFIIISGLFLLLNLSSQAQVLSLNEVFRTASQPRISLDPALMDYQIHGESLPQNNLQKLAHLSRVLPLRVEMDKDYIKILPVVYRESPGAPFFECLIFGGPIEKAQNIHQKIKDMRGWFLRGQVRWEEFQNQFVILFSVSTRFFLNQFLEDYKVLTEFLFQDQGEKMATDWKSWMTLHRDLLYENYNGTLPDLRQGYDPKFSRKNRLGPGSTVLK